MSAIHIPGLDVKERSPGSYRVRVRVHPFYDLTQTASSELLAVSWGITQLERLHALHALLTAECRLPKGAISREKAADLGLVELIEGAATSEQGCANTKQNSPGAAIFVFDVLDTYLANEAKKHVSEYVSRARHLKNFFGNVAISSITTRMLEDYIAARQSGKLGSGRSTKAAYASKNREYQRNLRRRKRGVPVVEQVKAVHPPSNESIRHELKLFRRALTVYATRDDALRERIAVYVGSHPITTVSLPPPCEPRKRRISDDELSRILKKISCPRKRAAIMVGIYTSIRRAEVVSLRVEDVNWSQSTVLLRAPMEPDPAFPGQMRKKSQTKTVQRDVPLINEALELLKATCEGRSGPIFDFKPASLTQAFGRAAEDAGVLDIRVHDGRRESLSWLHDVYGLTLEQLTMFSGHTEVKTLQKHYFQPSAARLAATLAKHPGEQRRV
jgi:integrase